MSDIRLVAFDLDGVLVDDGGSWLTVHRALGTLPAARENTKKYFAGEISFEEWARLDIQLWGGVHIDEVKRILYGAPYMRGAAETLTKLKEKYLVGIISGGLGVLAEKMRDEFNLDFAYGNGILTEDGCVVGIDNRVGFQDKGRILREVAAEHGVPVSGCAVVGDYLNDIPMFREAGLAIAFNPQHEDVISNADVVVREKDLTLVLAHL